jgi:hypothetical protein
VLVHSGKVKHVLSRSRDDFLLFNVLGRGTELWVVPVKEPKNAGRWVAYASNESSRREVYVKAFSEGRLGDGGRMSPNGGGSPRWGQDGKLYYIGLDNKLITMMLALGTAVQPGTPTEQAGLKK